MNKLYLLVFCFLASCPPVISNPFEVPEGFSITHFANDSHAHDIWCMTLDQQDRICVGGPGYIKFLIDSDGDGKADKATTFTDKVRKGPMGLLIDGTSILSVEANAVVRYQDKDGDLKADGEPEILVGFTGKGGEHGPHGIRKGPDGWYYVICGNNTGVDDSHANMPDSPIKDPRQGCVIRINPYGLGNEIVADGFRNPYDIAFSDDGRLFTFDSDNERDNHLPWHANCRVFDIAFGRHHGWLNPGHKQSYNVPEYYTIDRLAQIERGSPTGVEYYWHNAFPETYRKNLFYACWTFGRIYHSPLEWAEDDGLLLQERTLKKQEPKIFAQAGPEGGFAPVDLAIDSTGRMWVACGGRNTSGNVYCITPPDGAGEKQQRKLSMPQMMIGRNVLKPELQHPHTVRTFLKDPKDLHQVYKAYQDSHGGINHRPEPRTIDAGYTFNIVPSDESQKLRETITAESGATMLLDMDSKAEEALAKDAEAFAEFWSQPDKFLEAEPWRDRNYKELARTLGCVKNEFPPTLENITTALRENTHPSDNIHYLFCLAQMPAARTSIATWRIASAFLRIDAKLAAIPGAHPSRNWPLRLQDAFKAHCEHDSVLAKDLMWSHSLFGSSIHHARYIETIEDPELKKEVVKKMYHRLQDSKEDWTDSWAELLIENMPDLSVFELRKVWDNQPAIRQTLAKAFIPKADLFDDPARLFQALSLPDAKVAKQAAEKLAVRKSPRDADQTGQILTALVKHNKKKTTRKALLNLLEAETIPEALAAAKSEFPDSALITRLASSQDMAAFEARLETVDWDSGDSNKGKEVYTASVVQFVTAAKTDSAQN